MQAHAGEHIGWGALDEWEGLFLLARFRELVMSTSTANEPTEGHYGTTEMCLTLRGLLYTVGLSSKIGSSSTLPLMKRMSEE